MTGPQYVRERRSWRHVVAIHGGAEGGSWTGAKHTKLKCPDVPSHAQSNQSDPYELPPVWHELHRDSSDATVPYI